MLPVIATVRRSGPPPRVLLLSDHEPTLSTAKELLESRGYEVVHCDSVRSARRQIDEESFDVVVLGPRIDAEAARDAIQEIRGARERLPTVILSAPGAWRARTPRFTAWMSLPARPDQIAKTVAVACPRVPANADARR
jgi:DNA-binding NtrC family response regulator